MLQTDFATRLGQVRIPDCSADWRFLLPVDEQSLVLIVTPDCNEYALSLDAINVKSTTWRFDDFATGVSKASPQKANASSVGVAPPQFRESSFDVIAFPVGIPAQYSQVSYQQFRRLIEGALSMLTPGGAILVGFMNRWRIDSRKSKSGPIHSMPSEMKRTLVDAGCSAVEIYGAFPNLQIPEYIFSPMVEDLQFVLRRRYRHKLPSILLNLISSPVPARLLLSAVPFYYAVAYRRADISAAQSA